MGARLSCCIVILAGATCSGCLLMGALPPTRADIGPALLISESKTLTSVRFTAGVHAATVVKKRIPFDIGAGYVLLTGEREPANPKIPNDMPPLTMFHGGYLEGLYGFQAGEDEKSRAWIGARGEILTHGGWGLVGRAAWELSGYAEACGSQSNSKSIGAGAMAGYFGLGLFVEGGYHSMDMLGTRFNAATLSAGVTIRFPAMAGILVVPSP